MCFVRTPFVRRSVSLHPLWAQCGCSPVLCDSMYCNVGTVVLDSCGRLVFPVMLTDICLLEALVRFSEVAPWTSRKSRTKLSDLQTTAR